MTTKLARFTQKAREELRVRFNSLMGLLFDPEGLRASFERQPGNKAPGVDGMRKADYVDGVEDRIVDLLGRLRRLGYRPKPVRRVYIPKGDGRHRPMGVPSFEDRLVQDRLSQILQAIWEPDGVTHQVRFCEGPVTNWRMVEMLWHCRETRQQQRKQTSTCNAGRTRPTHQVLI